MFDRTPKHPPAAATAPGRTSDAALHPTPTREKTSRFQEGSELENAGHDGQRMGWADPHGPAPGIKGWFKLYWLDLLACASPDSKPAPPLTL